MLHLQYFSQQILSSKLLLAVIDELKSNFRVRFKLKPYNLILRIYCENVVNVALNLHTKKKSNIQRISQHFSQ